MSKHLGSCLCGEVRFEIVGPFERFFPVSLRALSKGHRVRARGQPVFINRKGPLAIRPSQDQDVSCPNDTA
jgi:hypothetical protein